MNSAPQHSASAVINGKPLDGIDELRRAVKYFGWMNETFNQSFSAEDLIKLWRFVIQHPELPEMADSWTNDQILCALDPTRKLITDDEIRALYAEIRDLSSEDRSDDADDIERACTSALADHTPSRAKIEAVIRRSRGEKVAGEEAPTCLACGKTHVDGRQNDQPCSKCE